MSSFLCYNYAVQKKIRLKGKRDDFLPSQSASLSSAIEKMMIFQSEKSVRYFGLLYCLKGWIPSACVQRNNSK